MEGASIYGTLVEGQTLRVAASDGNGEWQAWLDGRWQTVGTGWSFDIPSGLAGTSLRYVTQGVDGPLATAATATITATDARSNTAPVLDRLGGLVLATIGDAGAGPIALFGNGSVHDPDHDPFKGGSLTVTRPVADDWGRFSDDDIGIDLAVGTGWRQLSYDIATRELRYASTPGSEAVIGTVDAVRDGRDGAALHIAFTNNASNESVTELIRHITFGDADFDLQTGEFVMLEMTITDAKGASAQGNMGLTEWQDPMLLGVPPLDAV